MLRLILSVVGCLLALICIANANVLILTDADFADEAKSHDILLVEFYAPWCGHCKKLAPEFEKAAGKLLKNDPFVHLAKVDCTTETKVCEKYGVSGYPALKIFRNGELAADYDGPRDADGIVKYMRGQTGPAAVEVKSVEQFEKAIPADDTIIFGFFEKESKLKDSYLKVADTERDRYEFMYTSDKSLIEKFGLTDDIVGFAPKNLRNKLEPDYFKYDGNYDTDKIKEFLLHDTVGLAGVRTPGNLFHYDQRPIVIAYFKIDYTLDPKGSNYWRNRVLMVAKEFKRKAHFAVSNKDEFTDEIGEYGMADREDTKPLVAALTSDGKFAMQEEFSIDNMKQFVKDVLAGKLESYMKSEPIPDTQGDVKVIVGKSFKEMVMEADKDVLIEFYAPWCGHCKSLAPKYDELGQNLAHETGVMIAKMDATANDVPPGFEVKGFPTIFWVPKNAKNKPVPYTEGREVNDFMNFIAKHATDELIGYTRDGKKKKTSDEL